ncbi:MAG: hypothetical protein A2087_01975 [Spirochaetes bacterium GWD1_61_31]|nr:MAG: hypothetical protein A2Y37_11705 [Spirochaetes bacterium GWB1_60_80]OHD29932.1 MAG: hypothetical protein A2004_11945 [Spirochaetes bacterium GWC1_61_12]OHD43789.1 MAG: hypothetical protein A2087_01975 [Spirochaetes bacterium GWD1_61_31]OHD46031.1 MAG: hypothetical protein A2Y35_13530 [Spirochaetes bacterium GWE1_60_18]OHD60603.1 MAG: hypothetical protein A2Y32_08020 [Spirochaetes bacterium GWF1_60_12]
MKKFLLRSLVLATLVGILFVFGETLLRIFLPVTQSAGDQPIYVYNPLMCFWTLMGYSSIWMFLIAAIFGVVLGAFNTKHPANGFLRIPYGLQVLFGGVFIVALELVSGCVLNLGFGLHVWNYSMFKLNLWGQIGLVPALMWLFLTPAIFYTDDLIRHYVWGEPRPDSLLSYYLDIFKSNRSIALATARDQQRRAAAATGVLQQAGWQPPPDLSQPPDAATVASAKMLGGVVWQSPPAAPGNGRP